MGKTLTKDQRKHNKYLSRDAARQRKEEEFFGIPEKKVERSAPKKKWRPHSEIDVE